MVLRALAKDPKARFASVAAFALALEQASQRALTPTAQIASEQPALSPAAATGYETVAVAPDQPVLPTETTPSADLPVGALEPTVYPGSSTPNGLDTPQSGAASETPQQGSIGCTHGCCCVTSPGANDAGQAEGQASFENECSAIDWIGGRDHRGRRPGEPQPARALWGAWHAAVAHLLPGRGGTWTDDVVWKSQIR